MGRQATKSNGQSFTKIVQGVGESGGACSYFPDIRPRLIRRERFIKLVAFLIRHPGNHQADQHGPAPPEAKSRSSAPEITREPEPRRLGVAERNSPVPGQGSGNKNAAAKAANRENRLIHSLIETKSLFPAPHSTARPGRICNSRTLVRPETYSSSAATKMVTGIKVNKRFRRSLRPGA